MEANIKIDLNGLLLFHLLLEYILKPAVGYNIKHIRALLITIAF